MLFRDKLRELRESVPLTQQALADAAALPLSTLRGYEQGQRIPGFPAVVKLAKALGTTCEAFSDCEYIAGADDGPPAGRPKGKRK